MANKPLKIVETVIRDGHQSLCATRMRIKDMIPALEQMDDVGYYAIEAWGGATFDSCLRFLNEDPWERLRTLKHHLKKTPIQMLLRGQNLLGYNHYADDVVSEFCKRSVDNGVSIIRIFDALNDTRNLECAMRATKEAGGHAQGCIVYTISPYHRDEDFVKLGQELVDMGADSICIKDMAGLLAPYAAEKLVKALKANLSVPINLHTHFTSGMGDMTLLKAIEAGCDIVDTALSPLAGGTSQPCTESLQYSLEGTEYDPKLNVKMLEAAAAKMNKVRDKYLANGLLKPKALCVNPNILKYQVPGGMLSNLMNQLEKQGAMDKYDEVLKEVPRVRKDLGYPPLVTPLSQMVGTQAVMNVITGERYKLVPKEINEYVRGLYGKSPAPIDEEVKAKILKGADVKTITHRPADDLEPEFEKLKEQYKDLCKSDEDVLIVALFPEVGQKFLEKRNNPQPADEVVEVNLYI